MDSLKINEDQLLELLQDLIKIKSVNPTLVKEGQGESEIAEYIGNRLEQIGLSVKYQEIEKNRKNVISILKGTGNGKTMMLNGHLDTVSITGMEIEPFNPIYKKGKVYGRGAYDMKGGLAAMIVAVQAIVESCIKLKGDVILAFVADEEYASIGTEESLKEYSADAAIVCEPTNLNIALAHKGFAWIKVNVHGRAAHGSLANFGIDAIVKAGKFLVKIEELEKEILSQKKHPLCGSPSVHASLINGGIELSTYPDHCKIELERRTLPEETLEIVDKEIKDIISELCLNDNQFKADHEIFFYRPGLEILKDESIVQSIIKASQKVLNRKPRFMGFSGWMDSALIAGAGIPTAIIGPKGSGAHSAVEYVDFKSVVKAARIYLNTILDFCN